MMQHLRIEADRGYVRLVTPDGRTLTTDVITIKLQKGRPARIKAESKTDPPEFFTVGRFYANGR